MICLLVLIGVSGCWISAGGEAQPTAIARDLPTLTPTFTDTVEPSLTPSEAPTEEFFFTEEVFATEELFPSETPGITEVAQVDIPTDDFQQPPGEFEQAATDLIATTTQEYINQTLTAEYLFAVTNFTATFTPEVLLPTLTPSPDFSSNPPLSGSDCVYQVRAGDNLFRIGLTYGVAFQDLARVNGITNPSFILVGQRITIPGCGTTGQFPPPTDSGGVVNPVPNPGGGNNVCGPQYVVDQGDTLFQISLRCNVPVRTIAANNGIQNINLIYIDQVLNLP
jgi:LysM repeat protein